MSVSVRFRHCLGRLGAHDLPLHRTCTALLHTYNIERQRQEFDSAQSAEAVLATVGSLSAAGHCSSSSRLFAFRAVAQAVAQRKVSYVVDRQAYASGLEQPHLTPTSRWAARVPGLNRAAKSRAVEALHPQTQDTLKSLIFELGQDLPHSWALLTPAVVSAASLAANVADSALRMHLRWLITRVEDRLLDLSFDNEDATVMQAAVILSSGVNAGMRMLRGQAVLSSALAQQTGGMDAEAATRLLKALVLSGTHDEELYSGLVARLSRLLHELTVVQLADVAYALAVQGRTADQSLQSLCFIKALQALLQCNHGGSVHPYTAFQLYVVHVTAAAAPDDSAHFAKLRASIPAQQMRPLLEMIRESALKAQTSASGGTSASGSWHLAAAPWRNCVSSVLASIAGMDLPLIKRDSGLGNRFLWSHAVPHMKLALHCAPSSAYMFGPVSSTDSSAHSALNLPPEHKVRHSLRPSITHMMQVTSSGGFAVELIPFSDWAEASTAAQQRQLVCAAMSRACVAQLKLSYPNS